MIGKNNKSSLAYIAYVALSGYGPTSQFTLAEWLEARRLYRSDPKKYDKAVALQIKEDEG